MVRIAASVLVTAACTSHGAGAVQPDATPQTVQLGSTSDPCDGVASLTGQLVLSVLKPSYTATFTPNGTGAASALSLTVSYSGGTITCHAAQNGEVDMPASIDLAVQAHLSTSDGLFDESFDATVSMTAGAPSLLGFDGSVAIAELHGTFKPVITGSWTIHDVAFGGQMLAAGSTSGSIVEQASAGNFGETRGAGGWR
jgi:hypothetical protein